MRPVTARLAELAASTACLRAWPAWQIATARASAAWSDSGGAGEPEQGADHLLDLALGGRAAAADGHLHRLRRVVEAGDPALGGGEHRDAARLADGDRRAHVLAEVEVLERDRGRLVPGDQLLELGVDAGEPGLERQVRRRLDHAAVDGGHLAAGHPDDAEARVRHARVYAHDEDHGY